ncbi:MAG: ATP synthase F1 subunit delta [Candidatus Nitrospinota bacterium M3_3B_026]
MKDLLAAKRYATAFVDAAETDELEKAVEELKALAAAFAESRPLRGVMANPAVPAAVKSGILGEILEKTGVSQKTAATARVILKNGRTTLLSDIAAQAGKISFDRLGKVRVEVASALEPGAEETAALERKFGEITGRKAVLEVKVDPSLIGGIVARIGSMVYDGSVRNQLKALKVGLR